jgi:hypothetical protein
MAFVLKRPALFMILAAAALAADKDAKFDVRPAANYPAHQTNSKVTIGVQPFVSDEEAHPAFGKNNPYKYGILPILVVIQNDSGQAIRVDGIKVEYTVLDRTRVSATPAKDVRFLKGANKPNVVVGPTGPKLGRQKKNPLDTWEIEGRAFAAKMIPPGQSASGFFYFQAAYQRGATLYLTGLSEAGTGKELFYFEIPM